MAKRKVYLHIGPAVPGVDEPHAALRGHAALHAAGLATPKVEQAEMDRADVEVRRRHKALGLKRKHVEGAWAEVCRRAFKKARKGYDVVISQPGFAAADYQQVALALDGLVGLQLHLVLTPGASADDDHLATLVGEWGKFVKKDGRIHVLTLPPDTTPEQFAAEMARLVVLEEKTEVERRLENLTRTRRRLKLRLRRIEDEAPDGSGTVDAA
ncbi:MAG TPA: hypothetical protein VF728_10685 [Nocardioides sp.]